MANLIHSPRGIVSSLYTQDIPFFPKVNGSPVSLGSSKEIRVLALGSNTEDVLNVLRSLYLYSIVPFHRQNRLKIYKESVRRALFESLERVSAKISSSNQISESTPTVNSENYQDISKEIQDKLKTVGSVPRNYLYLLEHQERIMSHNYEPTVEDVGHLFGRSIQDEIASVGHFCIHTHECELKIYLKVYDISVWNPILNFVDVLFRTEDLSTAHLPAKKEKILSYTENMKFPFQNVSTVNPFHNLPIFTLLTGRNHVLEQCRKGNWSFDEKEMDSKIKELFKDRELIFCDIPREEHVEELSRYCTKRLEDQRINYKSLDILPNFSVKDLIKTSRNKMKGIFCGPNFAENTNCFIEDSLWPDLIKNIKKNQNLQELTFKKNGRLSRLMQVVEVISLSPSLKKIDLSSYKFGDTEFLKICPILSQSKSLGTIIVCDNNLTSKSMTGVTVLLNNLSSLILLDLSVNPISDSGLLTKLYL